MLTYTHNHAPEILLRRCSCHKNEKKIQVCNYDANLASVITVELKFFFLCGVDFSYDVINSDIINVNNVHEILICALNIASYDVLF